MDGCERPHHAHGYCTSHDYHFITYGDPLAQGPGKYTGRKRLEVPSYDGVHKRLMRDIGKASQFQCVDCGYQAEEWSYNGGCPNEHWELFPDGVWLAYTTDQSRYSPRCTPCHRTRDLGAQDRPTPPDHIIEAAIEHPGIIWEEM